MDLLLMATGGLYGASIDLRLISSDWPENTPGQQKSPGDWSVLIWSRHFPKQINTIQGAAEKQDELVSLNKHQAAYSQRQEQHSTCVFHSMFASDLNPDPQSHPLWCEK